jgi:hypothetical protein
VQKRVYAGSGFEFAARRCVDDGTPITEIAQWRTASIGLSFFGRLTSECAQARECRDRLESRWQCAKGNVSGAVDSKPSQERSSSCQSPGLGSGARWWGSKHAASNVYQLTLQGCG